MLTNLIITLFSYALMEFTAWFVHKYVMHGFLWSLHKDHHKKESKGFFEHNDFFFLIFSIPGISFIYIGMQNNYDFYFWTGLGITIYGITYFFVHDIFIHQRFKILKKIDNAYFKAIRRAHKIHHKHLDKEEGECFGMLVVHPKYFKRQNRAI
jgi:beta-carotene 3-hydroxylase